MEVLFGLCLGFWLILFPIITAWFIYTLGKRAERRKKKKVLHGELYTAPGVQNLLEEGREDEAVEIYQKFAGVDEYTARDMVDKIKREME